MWVRAHGEHVILVHVGPQGPTEVGRYLRTTPGNPRLDEATVRRTDPLQRQPRARNGAEAEFLELGPGASAWLVGAGAAGATRVRSKMAQAVSLARIIGPAPVETALGQAATSGRFAEGDLQSIVEHLTTASVGDPTRASEDHSLQVGTSAWGALGR